MIYLIALLVVAAIVVIACAIQDYREGNFWFQQ